jgi:hypothetical protein
MKSKSLLLVSLLAVLFVVVPVQARMLDNDQPTPFRARVTAQATPPVGPPPWYMEVYGSGVCTHMGEITVYQHHMVVPTVDGVDFYDGFWLWTAANGDQIMGTYAGHMPFNPAGYFEIHGYFYITGGTGRFVNARGEGPASGAQYMDGTAYLNLNGIIYYI